MKDILKVLAKFTLPILVVILLVYYQAQFDLKLPEYTARIVNVGIQQGGIENTIPDVITESSLEQILFFSDIDDGDYIKDSYKRISELHFMDYVYDYPLLKEENLYLLNEDVDTEKLNEVLKNPIIVILGINQEKEQLRTLLEQENKLPENASLNDNNIFTLIKQLKEEQIKQLTAMIIDKSNNLPDALTDQAAIAFVKQEYKTIGVDTDNYQTSYIKNTGFEMLGISLLSMVVAISAAYLISQISSRFSCNLRSKLTTKIMSFSNQEFEEFSSSSLITRSTNDIQQIQTLIMMFLRIAVYAPIIGIGAFLKVYNSQMAWVIVLALVLILILMLILLIFVMPKFQKIQKTIDKLNLVVREILTGMPVIRAFSNEKKEEKKFDDVSTNLMGLNLFVTKTMALLYPLMMFIMNGISILIIWVGAEKVDLGVMQVGDLIAFINYSMQIIMAFIMLSVMSIMFPRALISIKRIGEVFNKKNTIIDPIEPVKFSKSKKSVVEFKDVYFRYPDANEDVLQNINFKAKSGTTTAFIGSTGSGKSTLINLIPRFYDVTGGKILIDNINIKDVSLYDLRSKIGYVPQKGMLFSGTIESNLKLGKDNLSKNQLNKVTDIAQASEFIKTKKKKFASPIAQGGTNVSGGQRQRLAIARAIAKKPDIYIFDDSFSALDYKTDLKLRKELAKVTKNNIIFIVAQRINTILKADKIVVLDKGSIVGIGNHKTLMKDCEVYKEIALSQLSRKELENE